LFAVSFASVIFEDLYIKTYGINNKFPTSLDTAIKIAASVGAVIGQVGFGLLSDLLGRKKVIR
jgi:PHS family inorganic phosphate transporter-like MFS transporter